jgi:hypothetical protein
MTTDAPDRNKAVDAVLNKHSSTINNFSLPIVVIPQKVFESIVHETFDSGFNYSHTLSKPNQEQLLEACERMTKEIKELKAQLTKLNNEKQQNIPR